MITFSQTTTLTADLDRQDSSTHCVSSSQNALSMACCFCTYHDMPVFFLHRNLAAGTCNDPNCDCVEFFHQAALVYVGATPGWFGREMPTTQRAMKKMLSTEFKAMLDKGEIITDEAQVFFDCPELCSCLIS